MQISVQTRMDRMLPIRQTLAGVADAVRAAFEAGTAVYPMGGGTSLDYGLPARSPGVGLSVAGLNRVIDYPARDMTITVEAGVTRLQRTGVTLARPSGPAMMSKVPVSLGMVTLSAGTPNGEFVAVTAIVAVAPPVLVRVQPTADRPERTHDAAGSWPEGGRAPTSETCMVVSAPRSRVRTAAARS